MNRDTNDHEHRRFERDGRITVVSSRVVGRRLTNSVRTRCSRSVSCCSMADFEQGIPCWNDDVHALGGCGSSLFPAGPCVRIPGGGPRCPEEPGLLARCCRELARELQSLNQQGLEEVRWDGDFRCCWAVRVSSPSLIWQFSATCCLLRRLAHECQHCSTPGSIQKATSKHGWLVG